MKRPITTLFLLQSLDGKISTGATDNMDVDKDFPTIKGLKEGLYQYYDIEQTTDLWSLNSGRVAEKIGVNNTPEPDKTPVNFVIIDNSHLDINGCMHFINKSNLFILVTTNIHHPGIKLAKLYNNIKIVYLQKFDPHIMLKRLADLGCDKLTIQTGGTLNALFVREKLIDYVNIVIAPVLIGGSETSTLVDGKSFTSSSELDKLLTLKLIEAKPLYYNYLQLRYASI